MAARWVGALLYAAAGAGTAIGVLALEGPLDPRQLREVAPLAGLLGGLLGLGVNERWPLRADAAIATGFLTAIVGLVFFAGLYLFGDGVIVAYLGGDAAKAVVEASRRLGDRLPVAAPLAIVAFMAAGLVLWMFAALGRRLFRARKADPAATTEASAGGRENNSDPGTAGAA